MRATPVRSYALIAMAGVALLTACGSPESAAPAGPAKPDLATVEVGTQSAPAELVVDGLVEAVRQATLSAQTPGRVAEAAVDVNDRVTRGQVLVRLRAAEQVAGLGQAQAALEAARAQDAQARAQHDRIRDMYERKVVARATYDEAVSARDAAGANVAAARAALQAAQEGVGYTELRAPYDGVVTARPVQPGEVVAPGTPLVTVAALDALRVVVEVPQSVAREIRAQGKATVHAGDERIASARVTLFPAAQPQSGTFRARVDLPAGVEGLAPGMYAKVGFPAGESSRTAVPRTALVERSELRAVYVVTPDGRVSLRQVRLGRPVGDAVEVIAGLVPGERVALDPAQAGLRVRQAAAATHD